MKREALVLNGWRTVFPGRSATPAGNRPARWRAIGGAAADKLAGLLVPALVLFAWEASTRLKLVKPIFLPPPGKVAEAFVDLLVNEGFLIDLGVSLLTVLKGFLLGGSLGLLLGIAAGLTKTVERLFGPFLNGLRQVPPIAWLPLIVLWAGVGDFGKVVVIAKSVFFPVFLNSLQGIRGVSKEYVEVGRVFEFTRVQLLRRVIIPSAMPAIFVGIRYGAGLAWAMIVAAEMLSGRKGLGFLLLQSQDLLQTDWLFVVIVVIGAVGFAIDQVLKAAGGRLMSWKKEFAG